MNLKDKRFLVAGIGKSGIAEKTADGRQII